MFDLGRSFLASVARDPDAIAIVDGSARTTYANWFAEVSSLCAGLAELGARHGDRVVSFLQNSRAAATLHWACQMSGLVIVPVNWRSTADDIDFVIENAEAALVVFDASSREAVRESARAGALPRIAVDTPAEGSTPFADIISTTAPDASPKAEAGDWSVMLYTSGTTARPKGVPRRHRAERMAALAHVAQNAMPVHDRILGVMPLYHTMGVRSLLAMHLLGGTFVCLPRFDVKRALELIERERVTSLYLAPTLYHDLLEHPDFPGYDVSSVRRLGFAGASMTDGLMARISAAFRPDHFVNHYGSSEIYTFSVEYDAPARPGSAGRAGLNQMLRVVEMGSGDPEAVLPSGEEGEIIATMAGDEAFEGYWRRPEADEKSLRGGWYFTGDSGRFDADGYLYVTGRVDDMIITGGENVSPVEVESVISTHDGVRDVAVVGLPDERWGQVVTAFIERRPGLNEEAVDRHCCDSGLANFKRPRRIVFVETLPKSPVGKLLRRRLVSGDYTPESSTNTD